MPAAAAIDSWPTSVSTQPRLPHAHGRPPGRPRRGRTRRRTRGCRGTAGRRARRRRRRRPRRRRRRSRRSRPRRRSSAPRARRGSTRSRRAPGCRGAPRARRRPGCRASRGSARRRPSPTPPRRGPDGHGDPDRAQALRGGGVERGARGAAEPVEHGAGRGAAVVAVRALLVAHGAGEVLERHRDVVDVDLEPDPDDDVGDLEGHARPPDAARRGVSPSRARARARRAR